MAAEKLHFKIYYCRK